MALQYTTALRNAQLDAITAAIGASGLLRIYDGIPPANANTALSGNTLLATLPLSATAAPAAASGTLTFNAISNDISADATGTATFFRLLTSGGAAVVQGSVGTSGTDIIVSTTSFVATVVVSCSGFTVTAGNA